MVRAKTPHSARRNASQFVIGEPSAQPSPRVPLWATEYDSEYVMKNGLDVEQYLPHEPCAPSTPRSWKRGFVHHEDFKQLNDKYSGLQQQARDLQSRLASARSTMQDWRSDETTLLQAWEQEQTQLVHTGERLQEAVRSLHELLHTVEGHRGMMRAIARGHGIEAGHLGPTPKTLPEEELRGPGALEAGEELEVFQQPKKQQQRPLQRSSPAAERQQQRQWEEQEGGPSQQEGGPSQPQLQPQQRQQGGPAQHKRLGSTVRVRGTATSIMRDQVALQARLRSGEHKLVQAVQRVAALVQAVQSRAGVRQLVSLREAVQQFGSTISAGEQAAPDARTMKYGDRVETYPRSRHRPLPPGLWR